MSQIHYRGISLAQLVERSDLVLIVKPADPPRRRVEIAIGMDPRGQEAPAFVRVLSRCEVQGALSAAGAELLGRTLEIDGAHWQQSLSMHRSYYLKGMSKSPIFERYQPEAPTSESEGPEGNDTRDAPSIVFLQSSDSDGFAFVVEGAREGLTQRGAIEELLRRRG